MREGQGKEKKEGLSKLICDKGGQNRERSKGAGGVTNRKSLISRREMRRSRSRREGRRGILDLKENINEYGGREAANTKVSEDDSNLWRGTSFKKERKRGKRKRERILMGGCRGQRAGKRLGTCR